MHLIHYGCKKINFKKIKPIKNFDFKPNGGFWSSPVNSKNGWKNFCINDENIEILPNDYIKFRIKKNSKILKINTLWYLKRLLKKYSQYSGSVYLDFELISKEYDAIWLTYNGELETRNIMALANWDVETVLIMNPKIIIK